MAGRVRGEAIKFTADIKQGTIMKVQDTHEVPWHHREVYRYLAIYGIEQELNILTDDVVIRLQIQSQYFDVTTNRRVTRRIESIGTVERTHVLNVRVSRYDMIKGETLNIVHPGGWPLKAVVERAKRTRQSFDTHVEIQSCRDGCLKEIRPCDCGASWNGNDYCPHECSDHLWETLSWEDDVEPDVLVASGDTMDFDIPGVPF